MNLSNDSLNLNKQVTFNVNMDVKPNILVALLKYIDKIVETYPAPYTLMCSGGADSQAMLWAWELSGHEYDAVHITYDDYNKFDTDTLNDFVKKYEIPYRKINFDVVNFLENNMEMYAKKYQCASPHICTYMAMSELITEGTKIFAGNLVYGSGSLPVNNTIFGLQRYATISQNKVIPFFLLQDDNVISAATKLYNNLYYPGSVETEKIPKNYGNEKFSFTESREANYHIKITMYQKSGIPVISQNLNFSGFDRIKDYYDQFIDRVSFTDKISYSKYPSNRVFDHLFRHKYYREFGNDYFANIRLNINN